MPISADERVEIEPEEYPAPEEEDLPANRVGIVPDLVLLAVFMVSLGLALYYHWTRP